RRAHSRADAAEHDPCVRHAPARARPRRDRTGGSGQRRGLRDADGRPRGPRGAEAGRALQAAGEDDQADAAAQRTRPRPVGAVRPMIGFALTGPAGAWHVFSAHPVALLLMPVVGGFIGWVTKGMAIWMVFNPIEFKGIGPIGWQGQLPKRAAKFGSHASELILENLIDPRMLVDKLDAQAIARELDDVMLETVDDV